MYLLQKSGISEDSTSQSPVTTADRGSYPPMQVDQGYSLESLLDPEVHPHAMRPFTIGLFNQLRHVTERCVRRQIRLHSLDPAPRDYDDRLEEIMTDFGWSAHDLLYIFCQFE